MIFIKQSTIFSAFNKVKYTSKITHTKPYIVKRYI